jgi:hypothetical protein
MDDRRLLMHRREVRRGIKPPITEAILPDAPSPDGRF